MSAFCGRHLDVEPTVLQLRLASRLQRWLARMLTHALGPVRFVNALAWCQLVFGKRPHVRQPLVHWSPKCCAYGQCAGSK
mmetsp:Transcript_76950/g.249326  ORF Transcript_76950/g.249326 Transcript_76950/m.249326 type:complete len:80 (+) Transcript_76950:98-337(+)